MSHGLGRRHAPDPRDRDYRMTTVLPTAPERTWRYWGSGGFWGDQGPYPHCVGYAWVHWLEDGPVGHRGTAPVVDPVAIYREAQRIDEWDGENYDGTSVRAGAKVLQELGYVESYLWAWDAETIVKAILSTGPVVVGTMWYASMFEPDAQGVVRVTGSPAGGHAYVLNGVNRNRGMVRAKNSWSRQWGKRGAFWMSVEDLERLIREDGEAALAVEVRR